LQFSRTAVDSASVFAATSSRDLLHPDTQAEDERERSASDLPPIANAD